MEREISRGEILAAVNKLAETIGSEFHDPATGQLTATGLFARLRSLERKDQLEELVKLRWKNRIWGITTAAGVCGAVLMWVAGDRIEGARDLVRGEPRVEGAK